MSAVETLRLYKAGDIPGVRPVQGAMIEIVQSMPEGVGTAGYGLQAGQLAGLLMRVLPGGTIDRLLAELCFRKASLFRVPYADMDVATSHLPAAPALNPAEPEDDGWQPMNTAPNGESVDLWHRLQNRCTDAVKIPGGWMLDDGSSRPDSDFVAWRRPPAPPRN